VDVVSRPRFRPQRPSASDDATPMRIRSDRSKSALDAIDSSALTGGRYDANGGLDKADRIARPSRPELPGTSKFLKTTSPSMPDRPSRCTSTVLAFCSDSRPYVTADPSYEAGMWAAQAAGAKVSNGR